MPDFKLALAPNQLTQTINPWSWTFGNVSLFSVNLGQSGDPDFEARVLERVGSYGRQLGRLGEAMAVVLDHLEAQDPALREAKPVRALRRQLEEIADLKAAHHAPPAAVSAG